MSAAPPIPRVFRVSRLAYVVVLFVLFGAIPLAFAANGDQSAPAQVGLSTLILVIPLLVAAFIARSATIVDADGIRVRAIFGTRRLPWDEVRGLSITARSVYAVLPDGAVRLPCVQVVNLADLARASDGRLPAIADATPRHPPQRRRRR